MPWGEEAVRFLSRVLPWPASELDAGYGNVHFTVPNEHPKGPRSPKFFMPGMPFKSAQDAWNYVTKIYTRPNTREIYVCTSLQRDTKPSKDKKYQIARRDGPNTMGSKVLFLDIDVKEPPKGYETLPEAVAALNAFIAHWKLPKPSALVGSGGGLHCYWISNRMLTPAEWQPLAESLRAAAVQSGLRCDGGVTIDITRVLRIPETRNWKTNPPKLVKLLHLAPEDMDFAAEVIPALSAVPVSAKVQAPASTPSTAPMFDPKLFPKRAVPAMYAGVESGAAGLEPEAPILDTMAVFKQCPWLREALRTGGEHHDNPQWRLALVASTFLPNGSTVARKLSDRHPKFTEDEFDEQWERAENDVKSKDMGYPSCASIEQNGSKECAGCPFRGKIRSPLNLGLVKKLPPPVTDASNSVALVIHTPTAAQPFDPAFLPPGHVFNEAGIPCMVVTKEETSADGETEKIDTLVPMLFEQRMYAPFAQETPTLAIGFEVDGNQGKMRRVFIERGVTANINQTLGVLSHQGVVPFRGSKTKWGDFLMELARKMEMLRKSIDAKPAGWVADGGPLNKFAYGGVTYKQDGTTEPSGYIDENMRKKFQPKGTAEAWMKAALFVVEQGRQEFNVMLAAAFAGPLMVWTGQSLGLLMAAGKSGGGKTTIMKIAQAVWGHPDLARLTKKPTPNSLAHIMGVLSNLTAVWDDITDGPPQETLADTLMMDGKERERLVAKAFTGLVLSQQGTWDTMLLCSSNHSFIDFLAAKQTPDTGAARYRVFELPWIKKLESPLETWDVDAYTMPLRENHGIIGQQYAKFLAEKSGDIRALLEERGRAFDKLVKAQQQERYWSYCCACVLLGAEFARDLGFVNFDLDAMRDYLVDAYLQLRGRVQGDLQEGPEAAVETLTGFIKDNAKDVLITDSAPMKGRRDKPINIFKRPDPRFAKGIAVQFIDRPVAPVCRIDRRRLHEWLAARKLPTSIVYNRLQKEIWRVTEKTALGAGTEFACGRERVLEIDILPGSWLEQTMRDMRGHRASDDEVTAPVTAAPGPSGEDVIINNAAIARTKDNAS